MTPLQPRKLHRGHFAFMRALAQGIDERTSWDRYLRLEGEHTDLRVVRRTIAWIRDEFAAAARREQRPGTARLILLDPDQFSTATPLPSLSDFAQAQGLEDFSEAEQIEAYEAAYPSAGSQAGGGTARASRRTRVVERQLDALRWLEGLAAQDPRPGDGVSAWLNPSLATRLERAELPTLVALVGAINLNGARWWVRVPGIGERKAARILDWLRANETPLGLRVGTHAMRRRRQVSPVELAAVVPAATALLPLEKFVLPSDLDGRAGRFRAPQDSCALPAATDLEAIGAWLDAKRPRESPEPSGALSPTQRSYRKEAERLLLWAVLERKAALSSLSAADVAAYRQFLADPPASWCGPRHNQRWSPLWRPLEGPLAPTAVRQAMAILRSLFAFLMRHNYVVGNPFAAMSEPATAPRALGLHRTLSLAQWQHLDMLLARHAATEAGRRLRRGMRWVYATGLRLAEITGVTCGDLRQVVVRTPDGRDAAGWLLSVSGRAGRRREVPVPHELVIDLEEELAHHGFDRTVRAEGNRAVHVLARFDLKPGAPRPWSTSGFYSAVKLFLAQAARTLEDAEAQQLRRASIHWLRHAHGVHALQGRAGHAPVPIQVVQNNLGHVSASTTAGYLDAQGQAGLVEMQRFWASSTQQAASRAEYAE